MDRVMLLLGHPGNRRLLKEWLEPDYDILIPSGDSNFHEPFDLAFLDAAALMSKSAELQALKQAADAVVLPYVLLAPRHQASMVGRYLTDAVDELLWTPVDPGELRARIEILLRLRKQSVELKQQNDELSDLLKARQAVEQMKDEIISIASHELRSPLAAIKMYINMVLDGEVGPLTAEQSDFLKIAEENTERLNHMVRELLDVARMTSGRLQLQLLEIDLREEVQHTCDNLVMLGHTKHIQTVVAVPAEPVIVKADPNRVEQILTNLLSNAYKYSPEHSNVTVQLTPRSDLAQVDVADQGMGISKDDQERIFERFFRAESVRNSRISGTGLGLYITRTLVELHTGDIWVDSELNKGTTFSWTLPIARVGADIESRHASKI